MEAKVEPRETYTKIDKKLHRAVARFEKDVGKITSKTPTKVSLTPKILLQIIEILTLKTLTVPFDFIWLKLIFLNDFQLSFSLYQIENVTTFLQIKILKARKCLVVFYSLKTLKQCYLWAVFRIFPSLCQVFVKFFVRLSSMIKVLYLLRLKA